MNTRSHRFSLRVFVVVMCSLIALETPLAAQNGIGLTIQVLEGNNTQNVVMQLVSKPFTVRVMDRTGKPLQGATVEFQAPEGGAGGDFETGSNPIITTNDKGIAVAPQFRANSTPGTYDIQVLASYMGEVSRTLLTQNNVVTVKKKTPTKMIIIGAVVGGVAAAAFAAKGGGGGGSTSTPPPTGSTTAPTIVFLDSSVTAPR